MIKFFIKPEQKQCDFCKEIAQYELTLAKPIAFVGFGNYAESEYGMTFKICATCRKILIHCLQNPDIETDLLYGN